MKLKKLFLALIICSLPFFAFSQESEEDNTVVESEEEVDIKGKDFTTSESFIDFIHSLDYVLNIGPSFFRNADKTLVSAPSPVFFPITMGILWPNYTFIAMQPTVSAFYMYDLFYGGKVLPAEIENRTTTTICILADLPIVFQLYLKNSRFQISTGPAFLARVGILSSGVNENDAGYSGSAESDVKEINKWYWKNARFMYLSASFSWIYSLNEAGTVKVGPEIKTYFPIGGIFNKEGFQGFIVNVGLKVSL